MLKKIGNKNEGYYLEHRVSGKKETAETVQWKGDSTTLLLFQRVKQISSCIFECTLNNKKIYVFDTGDSYLFATCFMKCATIDSDDFSVCILGNVFGNDAKIKAGATILVKYTKTSIEFLKCECNYGVLYSNSYYSYVSNGKNIINLNTKINDIHRIDDILLISGERITGEHATYYTIFLLDLERCKNGEPNFICEINNRFYIRTIEKVEKVHNAYLLKSVAEPYCILVNSLTDGRSVVGQDITIGGFHYLGNREVPCYTIKLISGKSCWGVGPYLAEIGNLIKAEGKLYSPIFSEKGHWGIKTASDEDIMRAKVLAYNRFEEAYKAHLEDKNYVTYKVSPYCNAEHDVNYFFCVNKRYEGKARCTVESYAIRYTGLDAMLEHRESAHLEIFDNDRAVFIKPENEPDVYILNGEMYSLDKVKYPLPINDIWVMCNPKKEILVVDDILNPFVIYRGVAFCDTKDSLLLYLPNGSYCSINKATKEMSLLEKLPSKDLKFISGTLWNKEYLNLRNKIYN